MKLIYCPGVFDLMHEEHRNTLRRSKELGDFLIAGILTDDGAAAYKRRPVQDQETRRGNVADLSYVDLTVFQHGTDPTPTLLMLDALGLRPAALTHGADWARLKVGHETLERLGIEWVLLPYRPGVSTSETIQRIAAR